MNTENEPSAAKEKSSPSGESEPSRTCTDISIGDDRWISVTGLQDLIPNLADETLRKVQLSPETHCVSVALLSGDEVRTLNKAFRGKDASTNVLSFPSASALRTASRNGEPVFLGDVALAYDTVASEASDQGKTILQHTAHLVVHGVLHLAGFDHGGDADAEQMETAERAILARFGIPDPYQEDAPPLVSAV
jgi:probable rRNA maturation factor